MIFFLRGERYAEYKSILVQKNIHIYPLKWDITTMSTPNLGIISRSAIHTEVNDDNVHLSILQSKFLPHGVPLYYLNETI